MERLSQAFPGSLLKHEGQLVRSPASAMLRAGGCVSGLVTRESPLLLAGGGLPQWLRDPHTPNVPIFPVMNGELCALLDVRTAAFR